MAGPSDDDFQNRVRREAMTWLTVRTNDGMDSISTADLDDFTIDGEPFRLKDRQQGIRKPLGGSAALSIQTVIERRARIDHTRNHYVNVGLREAMRQRVPLIWSFGVGVALWRPVYSISALAEEPGQHQFVVDPDVARNLVDTGSPIEESLRRRCADPPRSLRHRHSWD